MRKSMNLKAMLEGKAIKNEGVALGDEVTVGRDDEDKREGVVKVPNGPGDTAGILIDGELEMVPNKEISRSRTDEADDEEENPFAGAEFAPNDPKDDEFGDKDKSVNESEDEDEEKDDAK